MFDPEGRLEGITGDMLLLQRVGDPRKRYFLPKGIRTRRMSNGTLRKKTSRRVFIGSSDYLESMSLIESDPLSEILVTDLRTQTMYLVPLGKVEYYEEVVVEVMPDNPEDYRQARKHQISMPVHLYQQIEQGADISGLTLEKIPSFKVIGQSGR